MEWLYFFKEDVLGCGCFEVDKMLSVATLIMKQ